MNKELLIRDNLSDTGIIPSVGSMYSSPDLIVHEQVENPEMFFSANYDKDVNQAMDIHSRVNLIYVRVKNISATPKIAYIHLYAANASLFLNSSEWLMDKLKTAEGVDYVQTDVIQPGEVGVGKVPFVFNALSDHNYCHIGYVSDTPGKPDIPGNFSNYEEYSNWLHGNTNICMRNFAKVSGPRYYLENSCEFSNPKKDKTSGLFEIQLGGKFPAGTQILFYSRQLDIEHTTVLDKETTQYSECVPTVIPAESRGIATLKIVLPEGQEGEKGGYATLVFSVWEEGTKLEYPNVQALNMDSKDMSQTFRKDYGCLIKAGQCTVAFDDN